MEYPALGFNFKVTATDADLPFSFMPAAESFFQSVSGISVSNGDVKIVSGGDNFRQFKLPTKTTYPDLVLKGGIVHKNSSLSKWCESILTKESMRYSIKRKTINVFLMDTELKSHLMSWTFYNCIPSSIEIDEFDAKENKIVIETLKISYSNYEKNINLI